MLLRLVILAPLIACIPFANRAHAEPIPSGWEARNFEPVGFTSTPGFKLAIYRDGDRWFLYTGSRRDGIFVIDVTKPENPITLTNLPAPPNTHGDAVDSYGGTDRQRRTDLFQFGT